MAVKQSSKVTPSSQAPKSTGDTQKDHSLSHLLEMGFDYESSVEALEATGYDLNKASGMLAQQSADLSRIPTKDTVQFMEDSGVGSEPSAKRKDRGYVLSMYRLPIETPPHLHCTYMHMHRTPSDTRTCRQPCLKWYIMLCILNTFYRMV